MCDAVGVSRLRLYLPSWCKSLVNQYFSVRVLPPAPCVAGTPAMPLMAGDGAPGAARDCLCIRDFSNWHIPTSFSLKNSHPTRHSRHGPGNPSASPDTTTWFSTHCKTGRFDLPNHLFYNPKRAVLPTGMGRSARRHGLGGHTRRPPQNIVPTRTLPFNSL